MFSKTRNKHSFNPGYIGIPLNPGYLIRRIISCAIREKATSMKGTILDFGCGDRPYESLFEVENYIGVDIVESGHKSSEKCPDMYYDGLHIPLPDSSVDHVISTEVFEHVFNAEELLKEIRRVLKPNGTFLMTCPFMWCLHEEPYDFARYTPYALESMLKKAGFTSIVAERKGSGIEGLCQTTLDYLHQNLIPDIRIVRGVFSLVYCLIFNLLGLIGSAIIPENRKLYLSNVVVAVKPIESY